MKVRRMQPPGFRWNRSESGIARAFSKQQRLRIITMFLCCVALIVLVGVGPQHRVVILDHEQAAPLLSSLIKVDKRDHNSMSSASNTMMMADNHNRTDVVNEVAARILDERTFSIVPRHNDDALTGQASGNREGSPIRLFLDLRKLSLSSVASILPDGAPLLLTNAIESAFNQAINTPRGPGTGLPTALQQATRYLAERRDAAGGGVCSIIAGLDLGSNGLTSLTSDLLSMSDTLEVLFLTDNLLETTPHLLSKMRVLNRLSLKSNRLTSLHPQRDLPVSIMHLIITENAIGSFESSFGGYRSDGERPVAFPNLRKLMLAGNVLHAWGEVFRVDGGHTRNRDDPGVHTSLELLRVSRNCIDGEAFAAVPADTQTTRDDPIAETVALLASFQRLSWLSFAGNPLVSTRQGRIQHNGGGGGACKINGQPEWTPDRLVEMLGGLADMSADVICSERLHPDVGILGQGASGIVKRCIVMRSTGGHRHEEHIAVKFFKRVSSDGSGADEIAALTHVPMHDNIVSPLGFLRFPSMQHVVELGVLPAGIAGGMHRFARKKAPTDDVDEDGEVVAVCFPLIDAAPLGKPPTIWTVSDDIFDDKGHGGLARQWALAQEVQPTAPKDAVYDYASNLLLAAIKMAHGILSAVCALHRHDVSLVHGDIYAHNMFFGRRRHIHDDARADTSVTGSMASLFDAAFKSLEDTAYRSPLIYPSNEYWRQNSVFLTDFGASFSYRNMDSRVGRAFEQIELNAYAVFVRDLYESILPLSYIQNCLFGNVQDDDGLQPKASTEAKNRRDTVVRDAQLVSRGEQLLAQVVAAAAGTTSSSADRLAILSRATVAILHRVLSNAPIHDDDCASVGRDIESIVSDALTRMAPAS